MLLGYDLYDYIMNKMPQVYVTSESIGLVTEIDNNDIFIRIYDCLLKENIVIKIEDPGRIDKVSSFVTIYEKRGQKFNKKKFYTDGLHIYNNNDLLEMEQWRSLL